MTAQQEGPVFAYEREEWEQMWENSRLRRVEESMAESRALALGMVLGGNADSAATMWPALAPVWALMLASPAEQAALLREES